MPLTLPYSLSHLRQRTSHHNQAARRSPEHHLTQHINNTPYNSSLVGAAALASWTQSDKYALGWVYFCVLLLSLAAVKRWWLVWRDGMRMVVHQEEAVTRRQQQQQPARIMESVGRSHVDVAAVARGSTGSPSAVEKMAVVSDDNIPPPPHQGRFARAVDVALAVMRFVVYRPIPNMTFKRAWRPLIFPSVPATLIIASAFIFTTLYCFVPRPLYYPSVVSGSPPLAIRAGMLAVALMPWLVGLSMKANLISLMTGLGHERLNALHRGAGWLCLFLSIVHTVPFLVMPVWRNYKVFAGLYEQARGGWVYGNGIAALVPLLFLCVHSLPWLRHWMYEAFVIVHVPMAIVFLAMLYWHCNNYLASWSYLWATVSIWSFSYLLRILFYLNWTNYWRLAWLVGDEASILVLPEDAIKVTIATRKKWKAGQYVYLRLPGISVLGNHPFTVTSLCSSDYPSDHGAGYRDMTLVFRPYSGFTKKVLEAAIENGPFHTYRAFVDGPYGGMTRSLDSFDHVLLVAGGSGITALTSHLLYLIKRMRQGKAVTRTVQVVWAMKRPDVMSWFKEELRICRQYAPPSSMKCQFYITAAKRLQGSERLVSASTPSRAVSSSFEYKVDRMFKELTMSPRRRASHQSNQSSAMRETFIQQDADGDPVREQQLRRENEDAISPLPEAHLRPQLPHRVSIREKRRLGGGTPLTLDTQNIDALALENDRSPTRQRGQLSPARFGFPYTPTELQGSLMTFASLPGARGSVDWHTEYGRPDIAFMLRHLSEGFGRRNCVFVCGPPSMRTDVATAVASLQKSVWQRQDVEEIFLHTENYSL